MSFLKSLYIQNNTFYWLGAIIFLFVAGSFNALFYILAQVGIVALLIALGFEIVMLYQQHNGIEGVRDVPEHLSNGDHNNIYMHLHNAYPFQVNVEVIDEIPFQFQVRNKRFTSAINKDESSTIQYTLRPTERGAYQFGNINVFASTQLRLVQKRYRIQADKIVPVYPSYLQVKKYKFLAFSDHLHEYGIKPIRKIGHNYEFDQIREFVDGDDYRSINWKATAKTNQIMVNQYQDEKSQHIYAVINMGRVMKMPFDHLSLLDYSINSALVMLNTAFLKDDKPGLITFNKTVKTVLRANRNHGQMKRVMDMLYNQETDYSEAEYEGLYYQIRHVIKQRSLLFMFTNFESLVSLQREINSIRNIARYHRLIVILFKNTELNSLVSKSATSVEQIYTKTIAQKFQVEKELIVKELRKNGIDSILTEPQNLTVDAINKYLEIKARKRV